MLKLYKINSRSALFIKKALLLFLILSPVCSLAQQDTTVLSDSLPAEFQDQPAEDPEESGTTDETQTSYFLKKWELAADSSIIQRHVPDSLHRKMQQDDDFWYANAGIKEEKKTKRGNGNVYIPIGQQAWFQTLLWLVIIGGFAAAIMWYLAGSHVGLFRRKNNNIQTGNEDEWATEDIFAIRYQKEIDKAEAAGNFRLAIRLMFLRLLKDMSEKNIIQYKQDRTNLDYLFQLQNTGYYNNFFRVTRDYEYSWYGQFDVGEAAYRIVKNDFKEFESQL